MMTVLLFSFHISSQQGDSLFFAILKLITFTVLSALANFEGLYIRCERKGKKVFQNILKCVLETLVNCKYRNSLPAFVFLPVVISFSYIHSCLFYEQLPKAQAFRGKVSWLLDRTKTFVRAGKTFPPTPRTQM